MYLRNMTALRFPNTTTKEQLTTAMANHQCGDLTGGDRTGNGFSDLSVENFTKDYDNGAVALGAFSIKEKILPQMVVDQQAAINIEEVEQQQGRILSKADRLAVTQDTIWDLLTSAFVVERKTYLVIDMTNHMIYVNSTNGLVVDAVIAKFALGSVAVSRIVVVEQIHFSIAQWIYNDQLPHGWQFFKLITTTINNKTTTYKGRTLPLDEIRMALDAGSRVSSVGILANVNDDRAFTLNSDMSISNFRYLNPHDETGLNKSQILDMSVEEFVLGNFRALFPTLITVFGGANG